MPVKTAGRDLNHVAWLYDPLVERLSFGRERLFREKTLQYLALGPGQEILDVGCGTGSLTLLIAEQLGAGTVTGIDAAPRMIAIAEKKAARQGSAARFAVGIAESLDFADRRFDTVVNSMFTHHINHGLKERAFAEMYRVLRPGGLLVTADIDRPTSRLAAAVGWLSRYLLLQPELEDNLRGLLPDLMRQAGFTRVVRHEQVYGLVSFFTAVKPG
jgi:ubiquinone/menaquinone biosynthesis C-methylase UbiE